MPQTIEMIITNMGKKMTHSHHIPWSSHSLASSPGPLSQAGPSQGTHS